MLLSLLEVVGGWLVVASPATPAPYPAAVRVSLPLLLFWRWLSLRLLTRHFRCKWPVHGGRPLSPLPLLFLTIGWLCFTGRVPHTNQTFPREEVYSSTWTNNRVNDQSTLYRQNRQKSVSSFHIGSARVPHGLPFALPLSVVLFAGPAALLPLRLSWLPLLGVGPHLVVVVDKD